MKQTFCDFCGHKTDLAKQITADLDKDNLVFIDIKPTALSKRDDENIKDPDLCADCVIKAIKDSVK